MELTYENVSAWFDRYFETVNECMGPIGKVPKIGRLFSEDFEFFFKTNNAFGSSLSREELLMIMIHPGVREVIKPKYYAINLQQMVCVVHFEDQIVCDSTGSLGRPFDCSVHYHFVQAEDTGLKIRRIEDWVGYQTPEDTESHLKAFANANKQAIAQLVSDWLKSKY